MESIPLERSTKEKELGVGNGGQLGKWNLSRVWVKDATHVMGSDIGEISRYQYRTGYGLECCA